MSRDINMFPVERQKAILDILSRKSAVTVSELSNELFVGEATIRRDLQTLEKNGQLKRTHGGAVAAMSENTETPFLLRDSEGTIAKKYIADTAKDFIKNGQTLFFDSSSTVLRLVPHLERVKNVTVITNGIMTAYELSKTGVHTILTGGKLENSTTTLSGASAVREAKSYYADIFFYSCRALSIENGVTESSTEVREVKAAFSENARTSMLLVDSSKFGKNSYCKTALLDRTSAIITETPPDERYREFLRDRNIKVLM